MRKFIDLHDELPFILFHFLGLILLNQCLLLFLFQLCSFIIESSQHLLGDDRPLGYFFLNLLLNIKLIL